MKSIILSLMIIFSASTLVAQKGSQLVLKSYVDGYYSYYDNDLPASELQTFSTVGPRNQSISVNVAQLGLHYEYKDIRSSMTVHFGDIPQATWSSTFPFIQEANVGVHLFPNWWLDVGLFTTHIGTESFLPKNNDLSTTSIITYNEPFYQGGLKLAYEGSEKYDLEFWIINGYNQFLDINKAKSYGLLFNYNINDNTSITYTNLFGNEAADGAIESQFRTYNNIYGTTTIKNMIRITAGLDYATQDKFSTNGLNPNVETPNNLLGFLATVRLILTKKSSVTTRYEYLTNPAGYITGTFKSGEFESGLDNMSGITLGYEYKPSEESYLRIEGRSLSGVENVEVFPGESPNNRLEFHLTMGHSFEKSWK